MSDNKKMGRPIIGKPKDIRLTIRVDEDTMQKLKKISSTTARSYSEIVRDLIRKTK